MAKNASILVIDRSKISYCTLNSTAVITYLFPPDVVRDLDVLNKEQLIMQFGAFLDTNKLLPTNTIIVLTDDVLFEKDILEAKPVTDVNPANHSLRKSVTAKTEKEDSEKEIEQFLDTVPFENIASKTYPIANGIKVVAANRDLYETIKTILEQKGFTVTAIIPIFLIGNITNPFIVNITIAKQILSKADALRQQTLPLHFVVETPKQTEEKSFSLTMSSKGTDKKRLFAMGGVFVILFGVMVVMYLNMNAQNQTLTTHASPKTVAPSVPAVFLSPTTVPATASPTIAQFDTKTNIQILASLAATQAAVLKNNLTLDGFTNVSITRQTGSSSDRVLIIFSHDVLQATRDKILSEVEKNSAPVSIQEGTAAQTGVTISL